MYSSVVARLAAVVLLLPACVVTVNEKPANSTPEVSEAESKSDDPAAAAKAQGATQQPASNDDAADENSETTNSGNADAAEREPADTKAAKKPRKLIKMRQAGQNEPAAQGTSETDPSPGSVTPDNAGQDGSAEATGSAQ